MSLQPRFPPQHPLQPASQRVTCRCRPNSKPIDSFITYTTTSNRHLPGSCVSRQSFSLFRQKVCCCCACQIGQGPQVTLQVLLLQYSLHLVMNLQHLEGSCLQQKCLQHHYGG